MVAHRIENIVDGQRMVVNLHGTLDDALGQPHIDIAVVDHRIGHQRVHHTLQVAHTAIGGLCDKPNHIRGNLQAITLDLALKDINAQLHIGLLQLGNQTARKAGEQAVGHSLQVYRRTVACQNNALTVLEKVIEDVEERQLSLLSSHPLLNIIDYQHIDGLIEIDEVVGGIMQHRTRILHLEQARTDIEHTLIGIQLLGTYADSIDEVGLSTSRRSEDKHRVERGLAGMLGYRQPHAARQLIAVTLDKIREGEMRIQLRVDGLGFGSIKHGGRLIGAGPGLLTINLCRGLGLNVLRQVVRLVGHDAISQPDTISKGI